jgi:redox-sensitive bicupin YhaK (pirin superfamily)
MSEIPVPPFVPRPIELVLESRPTIEGAGVHLRRAFGHAEVPRLDPFLLLDDFRSENPLEYAAGFPWHPHRGIETVTYMIDGRVEHQDSLGNHGVIGSGDVQWMTSGSGIIHQEMPKIESRRTLGGFQLWVNLPAAAKMQAPGYQEVPRARIPVVDLGEGSRSRVIAGTLRGIAGPIQAPGIDPRYLDVELPSRASLDLPLPEGHTGFAYVLGGSGAFDPDGRDRISSENLVIFGRSGSGVRVRAGDAPLRFLLVSGKPLHEPIAWWGPIVMNTRREIETALDEYREGTFIKGRVPTPSSPA